MPELRDSTVTIGVPGLNGTGVTAPEKTEIFNDLTALKAITYVTKTASGTTTAEIALDGLGGPGLLKVADDGTLSIAVAADLPAHTNTVEGVAGFLIDGGGSTITTGIKGDFPQFPFAGLITGLSATADQSGSIYVQLWNDSWANFPPTEADMFATIVMSSQVKYPTSGTWQEGPWAFSAGDVIRVNVNTAATSITRLTIALRIERSV